MTNTDRFAAFPALFVSLSLSLSPSLLLIDQKLSFDTTENPICDRPPLPTPETNNLISTIERGHEYRTTESVKERNPLAVDARRNLSEIIDLSQPLIPPLPPPQLVSPQTTTVIADSSNQKKPTAIRHKRKRAIQKTKELYKRFPILIKSKAGGDSESDDSPGKRKRSRRSV
jgi:hypothetical protein